MEAQNLRADESAIPEELNLAWAGMSSSFKQIKLDCEIVKLGVVWMVLIGMLTSTLQVLLHKRSPIIDILQRIRWLLLTDAGV